MRPGSQPTAAYIADLAAQLAVMAKAEEMRDLAYVLSMAELEARELSKMPEEAMVLEQEHEAAA